MSVPRLMSTQHPDNVCIPDFVQNSVFTSEDELVEARFCFETLGCDEQMWDAEGKAVDASVLLGLFTKQADFYSRNELGKKIRLTYRLPNPRLEKDREATIKTLLGAIPDLTKEAKALNKNAHQPIFEIILPQTESAGEVIDFSKKYCDATLKVIPLLESTKALTKADDIAKRVIKHSGTTNQRIFLARSDPALQSGMVAASLAVKIALQRLQKLAGELKVDIDPIIGVGGSPFRGFFTPATAQKIWHESAGAQTITVQSSFKYDYPIHEVQAALAKLRKLPREKALIIPEQKVLTLMYKVEKAYQREIKPFLPLVRALAPHTPKRRQRFGHGAPGTYSRTGQLPRAIGFTAGLYSAGLPPELFGLVDLTTKEIALLDEVYPTWRLSVAEAARFTHPNLKLGKKMLDTLAKYEIEVISPSIEHHGVSAKILHSLEHTPTKYLSNLMLQAAEIRNFIG